MQIGGLSFALVPALVSAALVALVAHRLRGDARRRWLWLPLLGGAAAGAVVAPLEGVLVRWTGLAPDHPGGLSRGAVAVALLLTAPLAEGAKVGVLWPFYAAGRIDGPRRALLLSLGVGAGMGAVAGGWVVASQANGAVGALRASLGVLVHVFCTSTWAYVLGLRRARARWFPPAWVLAVLIHALAAHLLWGRSPAAMVAAVPLLLAMVALGWLALRDVAPPARTSRVSLLGVPPSLSAVGRVFAPRERPVLLRWVLLGALVTLGAILLSLLGAVLVARRLGIDFEAARDTGLSAAGPLALLVGAVSIAFAVSGWVVARASASPGLTEPALAALLAIAAVVALLSLAAPVVVAFAVASAPVALVLACAGAWVALDRS